MLLLAICFAPDFKEDSSCSKRPRPTNSGEKHVVKVIRNDNAIYKSYPKNMVKKSYVRKFQKFD